jgi:hypothetical protein
VEGGNILLVPLSHIGPLVFNQIMTSECKQNNYIMQPWWLLLNRHTLTTVYNTVLC